MIQPRVGRWSGLVPVVALATLAAVWVWPALGGGRLLYLGDFSGSDLVDLNLAQRSWLGAALRRLEWPVWCPLLHCGTPLFAEGQTGSLYPANTVLFALFRPALALGLAVAIHFLVAGLGAFKLARAHERSPMASLLAAIAFAFGGYMVARVRHLNLVNAAAMLPWLLLATHRLVERPSPRRTAGLAFAVALTIAAGHPQVGYYALLAVIPYGLWRLHARRCVTRAAGVPTRLLLVIGLAVAASLVGAALVAAQLLPTLELLRVSTRGSAIAFEDATAYPFGWGSLLGFLFPFRLGNPATASYPPGIARLGVFWENAVYLGLLPLGLAIVAPFVSRRRSEVAWFLGFAGVSLLLALGSATPLYRLVYETVPWIRSFRFPARFALYAELALAVSAAYGLDGILDRIAGRARPRFAIAAVAIAAVGLDLYRFGHQYLGYAPETFLDRPQTARFLVEHPSRSGDVRVAPLFPEQSWWTAYVRDLGYGSLARSGSCENARRQREEMQPNSNLFYGIASTSTRAFKEGGLVLSRHSALEAAMEQAVRQQGDSALPVLAKILALEGATHVLTSVDLSAGPFVRRFTPSTTGALPPAVYEVPNTLPRFYVAGRASRVEWSALPAEDAVLRLVETVSPPSFDLHAEVLLEDEPTPGVPAPRDRVREASIRRISKTNEHEEVEVTLPEPGWLVRLESFYPGWIARVDGEIVPIRRANALFQAIRLPAGSHRASFVYRSTWFRVGAVVGAIALVAVALAAWLGRAEVGRG